MAMSRSARISLLLVIDTLFFWIELIVGYAVGSLALVADSFHMLNDVMSLIVALYAIKLTNKNPIDSRYSYGWHRAEILAALINGVFLLALCFSITIEAVERLFKTQDISNPKLIVIVGSFGLASNLVGLFLFHEHDHSKPATTNSQASSVVNVAASPRKPAASNGYQNTAHRKPRPVTRPRSDSFSSLYGHPVATRASLVQTAQDIASARSTSPRPHKQASISSCRPAGLQESPEEDEEPPTPLISPMPELSEYTPLLSPPPGDPEYSARRHGHTHVPGGSMNMHALLLHVFGDALGNVGVIATGLVIWFSEWKYKFYFDPLISLVITAIIFSSALPLVRSASFILLQAVPLNVSPESVRSAILRVDGVRSLHELHIWQLSESKLIASVHILASREHDFMPIAMDVRKVLHEHGVHSCTIQPEYDCPEGETFDDIEITSQNSCLVTCPADQECDPQEHSCCPPVLSEA